MIMRCWKQLGCVAAAALLITVVGGCSAAPAAPKGSVATDLKAAQPSAAPQSGAASSAESGNRAAAPGAPGLAPAPASSTSSASVPWDRMIIRTASLTAIVKDVEASITAVRNIAATAGGLIAQSNSRYDGDFQVATITLQIPAAQFDTVVSSLRELAIRVENENGSTQDVTEEYTDLAAQVRNFQATEASLQRLMEKATSMQDIIALQRELTSVRGEIEKRQGRMQFLSRRTDMSTITISLKPEGIAKPQSGREWRPIEIARQAWEASQSVLLAIATVLITIVVFLWWVIPLVAVGWYVWRGRRGQGSGAATGA